MATGKNLSFSLRDRGRSLTTVRKPFLYAIRMPGNRQYWRVELSESLEGPRRQVAFKRKAKAEEFLGACKRELRKTRPRRVSFLTSPHRLMDALEATRMLEAVPGPWQNALRRAASLYRLCAEEKETKVTRGYSEPESRQLELPPTLFRAVCRLAAAKGVDAGDLMAQLAWEYVRQESEKVVEKHTYPDEGKIPLRCLL